MALILVFDFIAPNFRVLPKFMTPGVRASSVSCSCPPVAATNQRRRYSFFHYLPQIPEKKSILHIELVCYMSHYFWISSFVITLFSVGNNYLNKCHINSSYISCKVFFLLLCMHQIISGRNLDGNNKYNKNV